MKEQIRLTSDKDNQVVLLRRDWRDDQVTQRLTVGSYKDARDLGNALIELADAGDAVASALASD